MNLNFDSTTDVLSITSPKGEDFSIYFDSAGTMYLDVAADGTPYDPQPCVEAEGFPAPAVVISAVAADGRYEARQYFYLNRRPFGCNVKSATPLKVTQYQ